MFGKLTHQGNRVALESMLVFSVSYRSIDTIVEMHCGIISEFRVFLYSDPTTTHLSKSLTKHC